MSKHTALLMTASLLAALAPGAALACTPPLPVSTELAAQREQERQSELWTRSDAVFLAEISTIERLALQGGPSGMRADLSPSLALKGERPTGKIDIRHSTLTSCGYIPFFDALNGAQGDWYVVYTRALPGGLSVDATIPVDALVDKDAVRAWRKAYEPAEADAASGSGA